MIKQRLTAAIKVASIHFFCGLVLAVIFGVLVFFVWFPYPYADLSNGRKLFFLMLGVDVVCGPLLTFMLFDPLKSRWKWRVDLLLILVVQFSAILYGLDNISKSRPVFLAFEGDRFRVVQAEDIDLKDLKKSKKPFDSIKVFGPELIGVQLLKASDPGYVESIFSAINGKHPSFRPERWVEYKMQIPQVLENLKDIEFLNSKLISINLVSEFNDNSKFGYLPLVQGDVTDWVVVISRIDGMPKEYLHVDGW